jgi:hypothetical protein
MVKGKAKMKIKSSSLFLIVALLVMLLVIVTALSWGRWHAYLVPVVTAGLAFVLGIIQLFKELLARGKAEPSTGGESEDQGKPIDLPRAGLAVSWVVGFSLSCYILGFLITTPLVTLIYLRRRGRSWWTSLVFAVVLGGFNYGMFEIGFQLYLYRGLIWELIFGM